MVIYEAGSFILQPKPKEVNDVLKATSLVHVTDQDLDFSSKGMPNFETNKQKNQNWLVFVCELLNK
jgi:hypothetical protein